MRLVHDNHVEIVIDLQHLHNLVKFAAATDFPVVELELALVFVPTAAQSRPVAHQPGRADDQSAATAHRANQARNDRLAEAHDIGDDDTVVLLDLLHRLSDGIDLIAILVKPRILQKTVKPFLVQGALLIFEILLQDKIIRLVRRHVRRDRRITQHPDELQAVLFRRRQRDGLLPHVVKVLLRLLRTEIGDLDVQFVAQVKPRLGEVARSRNPNLLPDRLRLLVHREDVEFRMIRIPRLAKLKALRFQHFHEQLQTIVECLGVDLRRTDDLPHRLEEPVLDCVRRVVALLAQTLDEIAHRHLGLHADQDAQLHSRTRLKRIIKDFHPGEKEEPDEHVKPICMAHQLAQPLTELFRPRTLLIRYKRHLSKPFCKLQYAPLKYTQSLWYNSPRLNDKGLQMTTSTLQVRVDSELRKAADKFFMSAGLDMSSAVRLFLKQVVIRQRLPFDVVAVNPDPFFSAANRRVLAESIRSLERGEGQAHELIDA